MSKKSRPSTSGIYWRVEHSWTNLFRDKSLHVHVFHWCTRIENPEKAQFLAKTPGGSRLSGQKGVHTYGIHTQQKTNLR